MSRPDRRPAFLLLGASLAGMAVAAGAFGAHQLKTVLPAEMQAVFETAVRYQMYHALALLLLAVAPGWDQASPRRLLQRAGWLFVAGIGLFCGSLYGMALGGPRWLGPITPLGGLAFIAGWGFVAAAAAKGNAE